MARLEISLNERELKRHGVLERLKSGVLSQVAAAQELGLSARQVRRLQRRLDTEGRLGCALPAGARNPTTGLTRDAG